MLKDGRDTIIKKLRGKLNKSFFYTSEEAPMFILSI